MKKIVCLILLVLFCILITHSCSGETNEYVWKDTHKVYKNTDYQILNGTLDGEKVRSMSNMKYNECIVGEIISMEETNEAVYLYGTFTKHQVYAILDILNNKVKMYAEVEEGDTLCMTELDNMIKAGDVIYLDSYEDFSESEKEVFERITK